MGGTDAKEEVSAVSVKLPTFWPQQPKVWFAQVEAQFAIRNITKEDTKYHYVISALDQETAVRVLDLLETQPENPYETLKTRLIGNQFGSTQDRIGFDVPQDGWIGERFSFDIA